MVSLPVQADGKLHTACDECSKQARSNETSTMHQLLTAVRNAKTKMLR